MDFILFRFVAFIVPATILRVELNPQGRPTLRVEPGFLLPKGLQGAVGLAGADTEWKDQAWGFIAPIQIPEDSALWFFHLIFE